MVSTETTALIPGDHERRLIPESTAIPVDCRNIDNDEFQDEMLVVSEEQANLSPGNEGKVKHHRLTRISMEKSLVELVPRDGAKITSPVWKHGYFKVGVITEKGEQKLKICKEKGKRPNALSGIFKIASTKCPAVCSICFYDENTPLEKCVFSLRIWNAGNCETHLKSKHTREQCPKVFTKNEVKEMIKIEKETLSTITSSQKSTSSVFSFFASYKPEEAMNLFHEKLYKFMNTSGLSIRQGTNPHLRDLLSFVVDQASLLKKSRLTRDVISQVSSGAKAFLHKDNACIESSDSNDEELVSASNK
jgi:hypothetical protein